MNEIETVISLNSNNTPFTIDSYATFTMEDWEYEDDDGNEQDFSYDFKWYLNALSDSAIVFINDEYKSDIILSIKRTDEKIYRPQYYNYTTDSFDIDFTVNLERLNEFVSSNLDSWKTWANSKSWYIYLYDNDLSLVENDNKLIYYIETRTDCKYDDIKSKYITFQLSNVNSYDYLTVTKDSSEL
jgi:hypothetical protein